jgi:hypothetical protein
LDGLGNITVRTAFFLSSATLTVQRRKSGGAVRKYGKHHYAICKLHGSEMCGREINEFATDLISKILISPTPPVSRTAQKMSALLTELVCFELAGSAAISRLNGRALQKGPVANRPTGQVPC